MNKIKKLISLGISMIMSASILAGCASDTMSLYKALAKSQSIKSMRTKTDMSLKLSAENLSNNEQEVVENLLPTINSTKLSVTSYVNQNMDKTKSKLKSNIKVDIANNPMYMNLWVDADMTGEKANIKEIIKLPSVFMEQAPEEFKEKEYMVMNLNDTPNVPGTSPVDYNKLTQFTKEFQPKLIDFMSKYAAQFNPEQKMVTKLSKDKNSEPFIEIYEVKLDDKMFKDLLRYTANNFAQNKDAVNFIREYMFSTLVITGLPEDELKDAEEQLKLAFDQYEKNLPQFVEQINKAFDSLENIRIIGKDGIKIQYHVNRSGYIVYEKGNINLALDIANISKLSLALSQNATAALTGLYNLSIEYTTENTKINHDINIEFPELNEKNSFNYSDLLK